MEKTSEIMKELANSKKINVEKNNGIKERFSYEKLLKSLVMVETPFFESDKIVAQVVSSLYDGIKTKEIKKIVYECLEDIDGEIANKYLASTQLKVRTSRDTIEAFDLSKIANTLIEETGASQETAFEIATEVWKELKKLNVEYLTAPMIREMVNTKLVEYGLEDLRSRYTRLGIPVYITRLLQIVCEPRISTLCSHVTKRICLNAWKTVTAMSIRTSTGASIAVSTQLNILCLRN